jgi:hypothetical protein
MDIQILVNYFKDVYQSRSGIPHMPIPQWQIDRFKAITDEFCIDEKDIFSMIDAYFETKFRKPVDYRFGHFATDMVFEILYFQNIH